ncbi:MAG: sulfite exporter TauE/SafE family protein [Hyphomicrobiales bacterium]|nr:sulfite exporter TauE/SafE family protein [Hyphomicrobiales bacterium]
MTSFVLATITAIFVLAGFVKGMIGLGLPTVAMGLLALVMTPAQAAALLVVPSFLTNVWQAMGPELTPLVRRLWPMLLGICAGVWAGGGARASIGLGAVLALYGVLGLTSVEFSVPARLEPWLSPLIGVITGIVTAATGVYMIPSAPYLQAIGLKTDALVQALGLSFTVATVALATTLVQDGALQISIAGASVAALAPALLGMVLGQWLRARTRSETFRVCFLAGSLLLGAHLALRGLI